MKKKTFKTRTTQFETEDHGDVLICEENGTVHIWLDPESCMEGFLLQEKHSDNEWYFNTFFPDKDFSDIPKDGIFKTVKEAKDYIISKLGELTKQ